MRFKYISEKARATPLGHASEMYLRIRARKVARFGRAPPPARFCSVPPYVPLTASACRGLLSCPLTAFQMNQVVLEIYEVAFKMHLRESRRKWNFWRAGDPTHQHTTAVYYCMKGRKAVLLAPACLSSRQSQLKCTRSCLKCTELRLKSTYGYQGANGICDRGGVTHHPPTNKRLQCASV